ncbi:hypothetical protein PENTCL1PPCAC_21047, partial [Pristionchus entomophagus]
EVLASLDGQLLAVLALVTLHLQHDLLRRLGLLMLNGLGLSTVSGLFPVVATTSLNVLRLLGLLVLSDLVRCVLAALSVAESAPRFGNVNHS